MATTLDDARIVVKIDTTQAEQAAEEMLKKRRGGKGGGAGGGGGAPPGAGPSPSDDPNPQDGGPGYGAQTLAAVAGGNIAGIPGLRLAVGAAATAFKLETLQAISSGFAGFFNDVGDAELRKRWAQASSFRDYVSAVRDALDAGMQDMFSAFSASIAELENKARVILAAVGAAGEGIEAIQAQGILGETPMLSTGVRIVKLRAQLAEADSQLHEARQNVGRQFLGQAIRDNSEKARDKVFEKLMEAFAKE